MEPWKWRVEHSQMRSRAELEDARFSQSRDDSVGQVEGLLHLLGTHQEDEGFVLLKSIDSDMDLPVAVGADSPYPIQLRGAEQACPAWVKHR